MYSKCFNQNQEILYSILRNARSRKVPFDLRNYFTPRIKMNLNNMISRNKREMDLITNSKRAIFIL